MCDNRRRHTSSYDYSKSKIEFTQKLSNVNNDEEKKVHPFLLSKIYKAFTNIKPKSCRRIVL